MIGIVGAHCTGKTTLALELADRMGMVYIPTSVSSVFEEMGIKADEAMSFNMRIEVQERILKHCEAQWRDAGNFITDRTPIDMMAYTMLDMPRPLTAEQYEWWKGYRARCMDATRRNFCGMLFLRPGIKLVKREKQTAVMCPGFIDLTDMAMAGILSDPSLKDLPRHSVRSLDMEKRLTAGERLIDIICDNHHALMASGSLH